MTITLKQFEQRGQAKIFLDMDGVLCDFIKGVKDTTGEDFTSPDISKGAKGKIKAQIEKNPSFWHKKTSYDTEATHKSCIETRKERLCGD